MDNCCCYYLWCPYGGPGEWNLLVQVTAEEAAKIEGGDLKLAAGLDPTTDRRISAKIIRGPEPRWRWDSDLQMSTNPRVPGIDKCYVDTIDPPPPGYWGVRPVRPTLPPETE
jgi:hypothetical protein